MSPRASFSFRPFDEVLAAVDRERLQQFSVIEDRFVAAMGEFDRLRVAGQITPGQNQNKGFFFNELIVRLLERCAGQGVAKRGKRPGVLLEVVDVDVCFPETGRPVMIAETKMLGTPSTLGTLAVPSPKAGPCRPTSTSASARLRST